MTVTQTPGEQLQKQLAKAREDADRLPGGPDETPLQPDLPPDRTRQFTHTNFQRMRTDWPGEDKTKITELTRLADNVLAARFADAWWLLERLYRAVREPVTTSDGEVVRDLAHHVKWRRNEHGFYIEDWSRLGDAERSDFLHELTIHMFEWTQQAAQMWGSAMFAKGIWEEAFAYGYITPRGKLTIDDRTQAGHLQSIEERYFAIFQSLLSRRADALVRSLERLETMLLQRERR
jgi:hypothetical protein